MSIDRKRVVDLLTINPLLFDFYLHGNLSKDEKTSVLEQLESKEEFLFHIAQLFLDREGYSAFVSFGLVVDTLQKYFLNK